MVFYFKYTVFWVTVSRVTVVTVIRVLYEILKIVSLYILQYFYIFIHTTISKMLRRVHQNHKWLVIGIQMQGNLDFWSCSDSANHMRFHALLKISVEIVILYVGLVPGWNYSFWILGQECGRISSTICHFIKFLLTEKLFLGNMVLLRLGFRIW